MATIIGLTGGIASGKSTVSKMLQDAGYPVVDADIAAREVVKKDSLGAQQIKEAFGTEVFQADGELDRTKLGNIIFHEAEKRETLNAIVHPLVKQWMLAEQERYITNGAKTIILDIPLLFESQLEDMVQQIIVVSVDENTQLSRLMKRNKLTKTEAEARMASQMPLHEKARRADVVIDNAGSLAETKQQVEALVQTFESRS
ncbi:dephospho-CoA kinase [Listeria booriae]|uniref:dephospho-CoA kinase n=1 Tax=Listeria booriae TaxID=1552123 RepID=UPI001628E2BC|nr:dephospho-CoA kinase [Listeria booriae]MBC2325139.1 dephospho-CoA kinase [Listeria booriae]